MVREIQRMFPTRKIHTPIPMEWRPKLTSKQIAKLLEEEVGGGM